MVLNEDYKDVVKPGDSGTLSSDALAFSEGFADGFGFSGLFARLDQAPLSDTETFAGFDGAQDHVRSIPAAQAKASLRATK